MLSLSASAQSINKSVKGLFQTLKAPVAASAIEAQEISEFAPAKNRPATKVMRRDEANNGIYGLYIMQNEMDDEGTLGCDSVIFEAANQTVQGTACNVKVTVPQVNTVFYGAYDAATKKLTCPAQPVGSVKYGDLDYSLRIYPIIEQDGQAYYGVGEPFSFTLEDDGTWSFDQVALFVDMNESTDQLWVTFWPTSLKAANGVALYYVDSESAPDGYLELTSACSIDDYGFQVSISGFPWYVESNGLHLAPVVTLDVNDDASISMHAGQNLWPTKTLLYNLGDEILALVGDYYMNWGVTLKEGDDGKTHYYFDSNLETGSVPGVFAAENTIQLAPFPIATNVFTNPTTGKQGQYGMWSSGSYIQLLNGNFTNGIAEINAESRLETAKNTKCYNALGQRVNSDAKGLVIRGGKKFFNK